MYPRSFLTLSLLLLKLLVMGQRDSIIGDENLKLKEGIYLNYADFRKNDPITKEQIESSLSKEHLDFYGKTLNESKFTFSKNGQKTTQESKAVWGFYQNNTLHVNYNKDFYRVPIFSAICYLVATVEVINPSMYSPGYGGMVGSIGTTVKTKE